MGRLFSDGSPPRVGPPSLMNSRTLLTVLSLHHVLSLSPSRRRGRSATKLKMSSSLCRCLASTFSCKDRVRKELPISGTLVFEPPDKPFQVKRRTRELSTLGLKHLQAALRAAHSSVSLPADPGRGCTPVITLSSSRRKVLCTPLFRDWAAVHAMTPFAFHHIAEQVLLINTLRLLLGRGSLSWASTCVQLASSWKLKKDTLCRSAILFPGCTWISHELRAAVAH